MGKLFQIETKTEFPNSGEDDLSVEKTRVRPKKKLKPNPDSDDESPERKPLGLLSNMTRAPIIGILLFVVISWEVNFVVGLAKSSRSTFEFPSRVNRSGPSLHCT